MAIAFIAAATGSADAQASVTVAAPAGIAAGDLMVALLSTKGGSLTTPAGWTHRKTQVSLSGSTYSVTYVYTKVVEAADVGASYVWATTNGWTTEWAATIVAYSGASPSTPVVELTGYANNAVGAAITATAGVTAVSGAWCVVGWSATDDDDAAAPAITPAAGNARSNVTTSSGSSIRNRVYDDTSAPSTARSATTSDAITSSVMAVIGPRYWETPNAPTLVTPVGGVSIVRTEDQTFQHAHSHPDSGDTQSAAEYRYRIRDVGAAWTTVAVAGAAQTKVITAGTLPAGSYEWQARTASSLGTYGAWSSSGFFEAIDEPDPPVFVNPTDDETVGSEVAVEITLVGTATQVEWRRVADNAGTPDTSTVYDSDTIVGNARSWTVEFDVNGRTEHLQARATVSGNDTDWASVEVVVSYTEPETPTLALSTVTNPGAITLDVTNPVNLLNDPDVAAWWSAALYTSGSLLDESGNGHDLALPGGTNDPKFLAYDGTKYIYLPGSGANTLTVPDGAALDIVSDLELVFRMSADDWTPSATTVLLAKWLASTGYELDLVSNGRLELYINGNAATSTAALPFTNGAAGWFKVTWRASDGRMQVWWAADAVAEPAVWTQVGADVVHASTSLTANGAGLTIGGSNPYIAGRIHRAIVRAGIGGTTALDVDTSVATAAASTFLATTGQTVTINRPATGRKAVVVDRDLFLFGTDDYVETADHADLDFAAAEDWTLLVAARVYGTPTGTLIAKKESTATGTIGWSLELVAGVPTLRISDGTTQITATAAAALTAGTLSVIAARCDRGGNLQVFVNGTAGTAVADTVAGTLANSEVLRVGRLTGAGTNYLDGEGFAWAVVARTLTNAEITALTISLFDEDVPDVDVNHVWRQELDTDGVTPIGDAIRLADPASGGTEVLEVDVDGTYTDWAVAPLTRYRYRVEAIADNDATAFSDWES